MKLSVSPRKKVLLISLLVAVLLISIFAILTQDIAIIVNISVIALFIVIGPVFMYKYAEFLWIKSVEREFPNFIRDLSNLKRSGMSLSEAVKMTVRTNYGKLTPEVRKFSNRLSWGINFLRALEIFERRFRSSKLITEVLDIVRESYMSGADIAITLDSLARDMLTLKDVEEERKSIIRQHVMIMYAIFYMFVGISIAIIYVLIPMMVSQSGAAMAFTSPIIFSFEDPCTGSFLLFPCMYFDVVCIAFTVPSGVGCYYLALFFSVLIIQAIFMGLISGQLGENSIISGIKHSLIMLSSVFVIFTFMVQTKLLPV
jgi:flagellar protein FlaJ